jgi:hypothetical protein
MPLFRTALRLAWALLFLWAFGLGLGRHSFRYVVLPLFCLGCLLIAKKHITDRFPEFGRTLIFSLFILLLTNNAIFSWWPAFAHTFKGAAGMVRPLVALVDSRLTNALDPCWAEAEAAMREFITKSGSLEAERIRNELDGVLNREKSWSLLPSDQEKVTRVWQRFQDFVQTRREMQKMIRSACVDEGLVTASIEPPGATGQPGGGAPRDPQPRREPGKPTGPTVNAPPKPKLSFNPAPSIVAGKTNTAIVVEAKRTAEGFSPSDALYHKLTAPAVNIVLNLFDESELINSGVFDEIYGGRTEDLKETRALSSVDYLVLGKLAYKFSPNPDIDKDLLSCRLTFSYKVFDRHGNLVKTDSVPAVAAALSETSSLVAALERLVEAHGNQILNAKW